MYFCCKICRIPISREVYSLEDRNRLCFEEEKDLLPPGFFFLSDDKNSSSNFKRHGLNCELVSYFLNLNDLINVKHHSDRSRINGCCGLSGFFGINTVCNNNHEIGIEHSDCCMPHTVGLVLEKVELINND